MPIRPTGSFRRYIIPGLIPSSEDTGFYESLRDNRFRSIDAQPVDEPGVGWVAPGTYSSSDFRPESVFFGPVIVLRMRVDRKKLPANAVRVRLAEAVNDLGGRVARSAKDKLKEEIERELLARTVPSTQLFDAFWRPRDETLLFSSTAAAAHDLFCILFRQTFAQMPVQATPTPLAELVGSPSITSDRLSQLAPLTIGA